MKVQRMGEWVNGRMGAFGVLILSILILASPAMASPLLIDDFEGQGRNKIGGKSSVYAAEPSRALAVRQEEKGRKGTKGLLLRYDKKGTGGPYGKGGWCGYYTLLKSGTKYFDATPYASLTFWVKGSKGGEDFSMGVADKRWDKLGDSVKSMSIGRYLPGGKVTTEWQKATVPLADFKVEQAELASVAVCFEGTLYPEGSAKGSVIIDNLMLE